MNRKKFLFIFILLLYFCNGNSNKNFCEGWDISKACDAIEFALSEYRNGLLFYGEVLGDVETFECDDCLQKFPNTSPFLVHRYKVKVLKNLIGAKEGEEFLVYRLGSLRYGEDGCDSYYLITKEVCIKMIKDTTPGIFALGKIRLYKKDNVFCKDVLPSDIEDGWETLWAAPDSDDPICGSAFVPLHDSKFLENSYYWIDDPSKYSMTFDEFLKLKEELEKIPPSGPWNLHRATRQECYNLIEKITNREIPIKCKDKECYGNTCILY